MPLGLCKLKTGGSMSRDDIETNFADLHQPFNLLQAKAEASRCLYCYDAPCINACPTSIDVPTFIHQIQTDNLIGSAKTILSQNIMGGTCARACPTEILCEQACVLNVSIDQPVNIGLLQRFAVDNLIDKDLKHPFTREKLTGKKLAVIGAGPAGLSCAHRAAMLGIEVTVFEAKNKPGGLNEYGLAAYKMADDFAQKEIDFLLSVGGIKIEYGQRLNNEFDLAKLRHNFDAVFIGVGLAKTNELYTEEGESNKIIDAIIFIENIRQADDKSKVHVGNDVIVIGAGNTAIDAAIQSKRLGAENVTLVYRRGEESMSATPWEVNLARQNGVKLLFWSAPKRFLNSSSRLEFERTSMQNNKLVTSGETYSLATDMVLTAIGQKLDVELFSGKGTSKSEPNRLNISNGKIIINENFETSVDGIFAGGDCIDSGEDLTVQAVQDGKQAAHEISIYFSNSGKE